MVETCVFLCVFSFSLPADPPSGSPPARGSPRREVERGQVDPPQRARGAEETPGPTSQRLGDVSACMCAALPNAVQTTAVAL